MTNNGETLRQFLVSYPQCTRYLFFSAVLAIAEGVHTLAQTGRDLEARFTSQRLSFVLAFEMRRSKQFQLLIKFLSAR